MIENTAKAGAVIDGEPNGSPYQPSSEEPSSGTALTLTERAMILLRPARLPSRLRTTLLAPESGERMITGGITLCKKLGEGKLILGASKPLKIGQSHEGLGGHPIAVLTPNKKDNVINIQRNILMKTSIIRDVIEAAPNRRKFIQRLGLAGTAATAMLGTRPAVAATISDNDINILNFALNLEYLEAEFYTVATTGKTIEQLGIGVTGTGTSGPTVGGRMVNLSNRSDGGDHNKGRGNDPETLTKDVALEIAFDERAHVTLLRSALIASGATPIAKPPINLNALGFGFNNQLDFLVLARALEDVGVTAYAGAAPLLDSKAILGTAARILGTEAEHAGNIRLQVALLGIKTNALDGVDIIPPPSGTKFFSVDNNALVQVRTPGQVLFIVYGFAANVTSGGFFPSGVNGTIKMSTGPA